MTHITCINKLNVTLDLHIIHINSKIYICYVYVSCMMKTESKIYLNIQQACKPRHTSQCLSGVVQKFKSKHYNVL